MKRIWNLSLVGLFRYKSSILCFAFLIFLTIFYGVISNSGIILMPKLYDSITRPDRTAGQFVGMVLIIVIARVISALTFAVSSFSSLYLSAMICAFMNGYLGVKAREYITNYIHSKYFANKLYPLSLFFDNSQRYYKLLCIFKKIDNPDQRICTDTSSFVTQWMTVLYGFSGNSGNGIFPSLFSLIGALIIGRQFINGPTILVSFIYVLIIVAIYTAVSIPYARLTFTQAKVEGSFRFAHARCVGTFHSFSLGTTICRS